MKYDQRALIWQLYNSALTTPMSPARLRATVVEQYMDVAKREVPEKQRLPLSVISEMLEEVKYQTRNDEGKLVHKDLHQIEMFK